VRILIEYVVGFRETTLLVTLEEKGSHPGVYIVIERQAIMTELLPLYHSGAPMHVLNLIAPQCGVAGR
jgi:hypothetical protein